MFKLNESVEKIKLKDWEYLANYETGSLVLLDERRKELLDKYIKREFNVEEDFFIELEEGGFFETVEQPLASAYLHVTNICNLNCVGCYSFDQTRNCTDKLSLDNMKHIISELAENGVTTITISGGEPLIRKDLPEILDYAKNEAKIETINLITNGTMHKYDVVEQIKPYINTLAVSIDGYSFEHPQFIRDEGIFPKVIEFAKTVKQMGMNVVILPTLHRKNIDGMSEYLKLSQEIGIPISFSLMTCSKELEEYIPNESDLDYVVDVLMEFMKSGNVPLGDYTQIEARKTCGAGTNIISITAEGVVYPCHMMHDTDTIMGNVMETPLSEIINNFKGLPSVENIEKCKNCKVKNVCGGGCKARSLLVNGALNQPDPYCKMNEKFYNQFIEENCNSGKRAV